VICAAAALACAAYSAPLCAQPAASVSGKVAGLSGVGLAGATVAVKNTATGQTTEAHAGPDGLYTVSNLAPGDYEISASAEGFSALAEKLTIGAGGQQQKLDFSLSGNTAPSLGDLGFGPDQTKGSAQDQARLDRRSHMLKIHQRLGLITAAPLLATIITSTRAGGRSGTTSGRELHAALGSATAGLYFTPAYFSIFAPRVPGTANRGPIRLHKALAWIHGPGMILTPVLGAMAFDQRSKGEKVHGIASAHGVVAATTGIAYGLALLSVTIKF